MSLKSRIEGLRLQKGKILKGSLALSWIGLIVAYQNFGTVEGNQVASKKPMPILDTEFFKKTSSRDAQLAMIAMMRSNDAVYDAFYTQSQLNEEVNYNANYVNMMAASNFSFINTNGFNHTLPRGLPLETASVVYRGRIYKNGTLFEEGTYTFARVTELNSSGQSVTTERLVGCGHCLGTQVDTNTKIVFDGPSDVNELGSYTFTAAEAARVNAQLANGQGNGFYDFVTLDAPAAIKNHPDVAAARSLNLLPVVDGSALGSVSSETPLYSPGYSKAYNSDGILELRKNYSAGRVQPDTQVLYLADSANNVVLAATDIGGANVVPSAGHSGAPLIAMINGVPHMTGTMMGADSVRPNENVSKMLFAKLPDRQGNLPPAGSTLDIFKVSQSPKTQQLLQGIASRKGTASTSCKQFGVCGTYTGPEVGRIAQIISNKSTADAAKKDAYKRIRDFINCAANSACVVQNAFKAAFTPALGLPPTQTVNGLIPDLSNNLIYYRVGQTNYSPWTSADGVSQMTITYRSVIVDQFGNVVNLSLPNVNVSNFWSTITLPPIGP